MNKSSLVDFFKQFLGFSATTQTVRMVLLFLGIVIVSTGLIMKFNLGLLILYVFISTIAAIAQRMRVGFLTTLILMVPVIILGADAKFYEFLYLVGCLLIGHALVIKIKE